MLARSRRGRRNRDPVPARRAAVTAPNGRRFGRAGRAPIAGVFAWNILIGFAVLVPGFIVAILGLVLTLVGRGPTVSRG